MPVCCSKTREGQLSYAACTVARCVLCRSAVGFGVQERQKAVSEGCRQRCVLLQEHPDVPVVEDLRDMWRVSKLHQERKAKQEAAQALQDLEDLKSASKQSKTLSAQV